MKRSSLTRRTPVKRTGWLRRRTRPPRPINRKRRIRRARQGLSDPPYRAFILGKPCCVTGWLPVEGHHVRRMTGMGVKPSDRRMVPVYWGLHREIQGRDSVWWRERGIDIEQVIRGLNEEFSA